MNSEKPKMTTDVPAEANPAKPNLIKRREFIRAAGIGAAALGGAATPRIDSLAKEGMKTSHFTSGRTGRRPPPRKGSGHLRPCCKPSNITNPVTSLTEGATL